MLVLTVPGEEMFNNDTQEFFTVNDTTLELEHSLVSLSKWEAKHNKLFIGNKELTSEEALDYIRFMVLTKGFDDQILNRFTKENFDAINDYISSEMTATWFAKERTPASRSGEQTTSELIYYWMLTLNVPIEAQHWHLNRLLTLIRLISVKNSKPKKRSPKEIAAERREINERRLREMGTTG